MTSDLPRRIWEHRWGVVAGFTKRYGIRRLVYAESHATIEGAILREKRIKKWNRSWKIDLIEETNPGWKDLYEELCT